MVNNRFFFVKKMVISRSMKVYKLGEFGNPVYLEMGQHWSKKLRDEVIQFRRVDFWEFLSDISCSCCSFLWLRLLNNLCVHACISVS